MKRMMTIQERRKQRGSLGVSKSKLHVEDEALDRNKYTYRWVNDRDGRVQELSREGRDWEIVPDRDNDVKKDGNNMGAQASVRVGTQENGGPVNGVFMRKLKEYDEMDRALAQEEIDATERGLSGGDGASTAGLVDKAYTPKGGGMRVSR